jgi:hypothetical protein
MEARSQSAAHPNEMNFIFNLNAFSWKAMQRGPRTMTLIGIKPHRWGWKVFEAPGVEPVFPQKDQAIGLCGNPRVLPLR